MFSQHTLFPSTLLGAFCVMGQGGGSNPCHVLNAQSRLLKEKPTTGH